MKRKLLIALMSVCILALALVGSTMAAGVQQSTALVNNVTTPAVAVTVQAETPPAPELALTAGQSMTPNYYAANNGSIPEYIVITATKSWKNAAGEVQTDADNALITMALANPDDWIDLTPGGAGAENCDQVILLYKKPVAPGGKTTVGVEGITLAKDLRTVKDLSAAMDVTAASVQYVAGQPEVNADAIATAYGVAVTVSADGTAAKA